MNSCTSIPKPCIVPSQEISMASMNNWLGFSLSSSNHDYPLQLQTSSVSDLGFHSDEQFDLTPNSTIPSIFEAFNTNPPSSHDWNMKDASFSCNTLENQETPKLENFLEVGGQSFADDNMNNGDSHNMGLSMIKNWLRSNPPPPHDNEAAPPVAGGQTLSLSMSTSSQSSENKGCGEGGGGGGGGGGAIESVPRKSIETFGQRTSIYRGVTRHRWTGRYEAHLWDNSCRREGQTRKGRQVYLGGYDKEEKAARAYDLAALKYWGTTTTTNLPISTYERELEEMKHMTRQEYVASLRRKSSGFSRGASIYRGVTRHHQHGRWQARIGRVAGNKDLYLGTFSTQEEAAEAYDVAAIKFRGLNAVTNFETSRYDVRSIMESRSLPPISKRLKDADKAALQVPRVDESDLIISQAAYGWPAAVGSHSHHLGQVPLTMYPYQQRMLWCKQEQEDSNSNNVGFNDIHHHLQIQLGQKNQQQGGFMQAASMSMNSLSGLDSQPGPGPNLVAYDNSNAAACDDGIINDGGFGYEGVSFGLLGVGDANCRNLYYHQPQQLSSNHAPTFTMWNGT